MNTGTATLTKTKIAEITNILPFGFWILIDDNEFFIDYKQYPMFYNARISEINDFSIDAMGNFHWESLDVDIEKGCYRTSGKLSFDLFLIYLFCFLLISNPSNISIRNCSY